MLATVTISQRAAERLRGGYPWVERREVVRREGGGDLVRVVDGRGRSLGTALWSDGARLALRLWSREEEPCDAPTLGARLGAALAQRRALFPDADAYRVVHGEADLLPGLFVDRYGDVAVIQSLCPAMDAREGLLAELLSPLLGARLVVARDDGAARDFEGLPRRQGVLSGSGSTVVEYHDAGSRLVTDVLVDGKTGGFLDQQENHRRAGEYARLVVDRPQARALDAFSFHGGFALALAAAGLPVLAADESAAAVARGRDNAARNRVPVTTLQANAFDLLRRLEGDGERFDLVVLDPPALAKRGAGRDGLVAAERAYKELNLRALRLLKAGGYLVTCSCSGKLTPTLFAAVVERAAADVGRPLQLLERRGAGRDHPPLLGLAETDYLKCWILKVLT